MEAPLTEVGTGVIIAILIIREIKPFLIKNGNKKSNGFITRSEHDKLFDIFQRKDMCNEIRKSINSRFDNVDKGLKEVKTLIENSKE